MDRSKKSVLLKEISCNVCGKIVPITNDVLKEDMFEAVKEWGYFSKYDVEIHKFNICESCYDAFTSSFKIPVKVVKKKEVI